MPYLVDDGIRATLLRASLKSCRPTELATLSISLVIGVTDQCQFMATVDIDTVVGNIGRKVAAPRRHQYAICAHEESWHRVVRRVLPWMESSDRLNDW